MPPPYGQPTWLAAHALASRLNNARAFKGYVAVAESIERERHDDGGGDVPGLLASPIFALYIASVIVTGAILAIIW
jgi:hypothetical protein